MSQLRATEHWGQVIPEFLCFSKGYSCRYRSPYCRSWKSYVIPYTLPFMAYVCGGYMHMSVPGYKVFPSVTLYLVSLRQGSSLNPKPAVCSVDWLSRKICLSLPTMLRLQVPAALPSSLHGSWGFEFRSLCFQMQTLLLSHLPSP